MATIQAINQVKGANERQQSETNRMNGLEEIDGKVFLFVCILLGRESVGITTKMSKFDLTTNAPNVEKDDQKKKKKIWKNFHVKIIHFSSGVIFMNGKTI